MNVDFKQIIQNFIKTIPILIIIYISYFSVILDRIGILLFCIIFCVVFFFIIFSNMKTQNNPSDGVKHYYNWRLVFILFIGLILHTDHDIKILLLTIICLLIPYQIKKLLIKFKVDKVSYGITTSYLEILFYLFALFSFITYLDKTTKHFLSIGAISEDSYKLVVNHYAIMAISLLIVIIFIKSLFNMLIGLIRTFVDFNKVSQSKKSPKLKVFFLVGLIVIISIAPHVYFAVLYDFFIATYELGSYSFWDKAYFSFCLQYAMPMAESLEISKLTTNLNLIPSGRIIQFSHIVSTRVIEITLFASVGNIVYQLISSSKSKQE